MNWRKSVTHADQNSNKSLKMVDMVETSEIRRKYFPLAVDDESAVAQEVLLWANLLNHGVGESFCIHDHERLQDRCLLLMPGIEASTRPEIVRLRERLGDQRHDFLADMLRMLLPCDPSECPNC